MANGFLPLYSFAVTFRQEMTLNSLCLVLKSCKTDDLFKGGLHISNVILIGIFILMGTATLWQQHQSLSVRVS